MKVLIAEADRALGMFLGRSLREESFEACCVADGEAAVERFLAETPDLVVLDLSLPRRDGPSVLRAIREADDAVPMVVLTAQTDAETRIACLDWGADDCLVKPFSLGELRARCRALMRRRGAVHLVLRYGGIELNRVEHSVGCNGEMVEMTNKEFALLEYLMLHHGQCVSRARLLREVWNMSPANGTNVVDVYVNYLRRKLGEPTSRSVIETVRGEGYRFAGARAQSA